MATRMRNISEVVEVGGVAAKVATEMHRMQYKETGMCVLLCLDGDVQVHELREQNTY